MRGDERYGRLAGTTRPVVGVLPLIGLGAVLLSILALMFVYLSSDGDAGSAVREALVRAEFLADQDDAQRRVAYARERFEGGDVIEAVRILEPLEAAGDPAAAALRRDIEYAAYNFLGPPWAGELAERLRTAVAGLQTLRPADADMARSLGLFSILARRAEAAGDWRVAARNHVLAGDAAAATEAFARALDVEVLDEAVNAALAAGAVDRALEWLARYRDVEPGARERLLEIARQTASHEYLTPGNRLLPPDFPDRDAWHAASVRAQIARGETASAIDLADRIVAEDPDSRALRLLRWQALRFAGRPGEALRRDALWLVRNDDESGEVFAASVADASALYEYGIADALFRARRAKAPLGDAELDAWFAVAEISGTWDQAVEDIEALLAASPTRGRLHDWKARFADLRNDRRALREHWPDFVRHGTPTLDALVAFSRAFWLRDENDAALAVLDHAGPDVRAEPEYWEVRAEVARRAGDRIAYDASVDRLVDFGLADQWQQLSYAERRIADADERIDFYWRLWEDTGNSLVLVRIAADAMAIDSAGDITRVRAALPRVTRPADRVELHLMLGQYAVRNGDVDGAYDDFRAGLAIVPNQPDLIQSRAWLSLDTGRSEGLEAAWRVGRTRWRDEAWALQLAAIAGRRGDVRQARFLGEYLRGLRPDDLAIGFNLYLTYQDIGMGDTARALATDLLTRVEARLDGTVGAAADPGRPPIPNYVRSGLIAALRGDRAHHERLDAALFAAGSGDAFELALGSLLRLDRFEAARARYGRWTLARRDVAGFLALQMALRENDLGRAAELVDGPDADRLPPADVVAALLQLGEPARAMAFAEARLGRVGDRDDVTEQLRRQAVAVREEAHDVVHLGYRDLGEGYRRTEVSTRFVQTDGLWRVAARRDDLGLVDTAGAALAIEAVTLMTSYRRVGREFDWELGADLDTAGSDRVGVTFEADHRVDSAIAWGMRADLATTAQLDNQWRALGRRDALGVDLVVRPLRRLGLVGALTRERYRPRSGDGSVDATVLNVGATYELSRLNPRTSLFADHSRRTFDDDDPLTAFADGRAVPLAPRDFAFSRIGVRFQEGQLDDEEIRNRWLNWILEVAGSCDHEASICGVDVAAGLGLRVIGRDRLSLTATRTTAQPLEGRADDGVSFRIDYTRHF